MKKTVLSFILILLFQLIFAAWSDDAAVNNVVCNLTGEQAIPKTAVCQDGSFYIAWFSNDSGNYDVRAQYFDYDGNEQWETNGILVSDHSQMSWLTQWDICCDPAGNLILAFQDTRYYENPDIMVYKIAPDGSFSWGDDGIAITNADISYMVPTVAATTENNVVVAWITEDGIGLQGISADGTIVSDPFIDMVDDSFTYNHPQLVPSDNDCVIMKYFKDTGPYYSPTRHIYAMKYDSSLEEVWDEEAVISTQGGVSAWTQQLSISPDEEGGFGIAWNDDRDSDNMSEVFAQWVFSDGTTAYPDGGVAVSTSATTVGYYPQAVVDPVEARLTVFWNEMDGDQNMRGLTGQKLNQSGSRLWGETGVTLISLGSDNPYPFGVQGALTDAMTQNSILFYTIDAPAANTDYIMAMCIDPDGSQVWLDGSVYVCQTANDIVHPVVANTNQQYIFATWEDSRNGSADIYAQNISFDGELGPVVSPTGIAGTVTLDGGDGSVEDVAIVIDNDIYHPDVNGYFYILLDPGAYTIAFELEHYDTVLLADVVVSEGEINDAVDVTLEYIQSSGELDIPPAEFGLDIYPNPFNPVTNIAWSIPEAGDVRIDVFDIKGRRVASTTKYNLPAGEGSYTLNAEGFGSGIFFIKIQSGSNSTVRKAVLLK